MNKHTKERVPHVLGMGQGEAPRAAGGSAGCMAKGAQDGKLQEATIFCEKDRHRAAPNLRNAFQSGY